MTGGWPDKPNLEDGPGLYWCCDTLGYVDASTRWDHVEDAMEVSQRKQEAWRAAKAAEAAAAQAQGPRHEPGTP